MPLRKIQSTWRALRKYLEEQDSDAFPIFEHWDKNYVTGGAKNKEPKFPPDMWNTYEKTIMDRPRTSNDVESWHRRLMVTFLRPHLTISQFIEELMKEWLFIESQISHLESGREKKDLKRMMKSADIERLAKIKRVVERGGQEGESPIDYLIKIAAATKKTK